MNGWRTSSRRVVPALLGRVAAIGALLAALPVWASGSPATPPTGPAAPLRIAWHISQTPPFAITFGPRTGEGVSERMVASLMRRLPAHAHELRIEPLARIITLARGGEPICTTGLLATPEREGFLTFSSTVRVEFGNRLFVRSTAATEAGLDGDQPVSLVDLVKRLGLRLAVLRERTYGRELDAMIEAAAPPRGHVTAISSDRLIAMALGDRVDAFLAYPSEVAYQLSLLPSPPTTPLRSFPLTGSAFVLVPLVACTRGADVANLVPEVDRMMQTDPDLHDEAIAHYVAWLDADSRALYRHQVQRRSAN